MKNKLWFVLFWLALALVAVVFFQGRGRRADEPAPAGAPAFTPSAQEQLTALQAERDAATNRAAALERELAERRGDLLEKLRLRAKVTQLEQALRAATLSESAPAAAPATPGAPDRPTTFPDASNARGVAYAGGSVLNFTNGVATVRPPGSDPTSASDVATYTLGQLFQFDDHQAYYELSENDGGSGTITSLAILTKDASGNQQMASLSLGDRVQIYNLEAQDGKLDVYYFDHGATGGMAGVPTVPTKATFTLDPGTGQYVPGGTFILSTDQPWVKAK